MVKKVVKNKSKKISKTKVIKTTEKNIKDNLLDFNNEFKELDSALSKTKLIKLQQWLYSLIVGYSKYELFICDCYLYVCFVVQCLYCSIK